MDAKKHKYDDLKSWAPVREFKVNDSLELTFNEFTLHNQLWAENVFEDFDTFWKKIFGNPVEKLNPDVNAMLLTSIQMLTESSKAELEKFRKKPNERLVDILAKVMGRKYFNDFCLCLHSVILDSYDLSTNKKKETEEPQQL